MLALAAVNKASNADTQDLHLDFLIVALYALDTKPTVSMNLCREPSLQI